MSNIVSFSQVGRIAGTWKHCDGFDDVEYRLSVVEGKLSVSIVDSSDGEAPEIFDVQWIENQQKATFAALWSSGRFVKYALCVGPNNDRVQATITTTWQELWERK